MDWISKVVGWVTRGFRNVATWSLLGWATVGLVAILVATILGDNAKDHDTTVFAATVFDALEHGRRLIQVKEPPWYANLHFWAGALKEAGFAVFIAAFVGLVIEQRSRLRMEQEISTYTQSIAKDVFLSTMRLSASESVWDELQELINKMQVIRENLVATYELVELKNVPELGLDPDLLAELSPDYVALKWNSDFRIINKSELPVDHVLTYTYPVRHELEHARELSVIHRIKAGKEEKSREDIERESSGAEWDEGERLFRWPIQIPPKDHLDVSSTIYLLKGRGDNEVWATMLPTENFHLTFINSLGDHLETGIQSNFSGQMDEEQPSQAGQVRRWRATRPLLPFQSVIVWWRLRDRPSRPPETGDEVTPRKTTRAGKAGAADPGASPDGASPAPGDGPRRRKPGNRAK